MDLRSVQAAHARPTVIDVAPQPAQPGDAPAVRMWFPRVPALQAVKDGAGQVLARSAGLAAWLSVQDEFVAAPAVAMAGSALSGALIGYRLGQHQFGPDTTLGRTATALSMVAGGGLGLAFAVGHAPAVLAALWSVAQAGFLLVVVRCIAHRSQDTVTPRQKAVVALSAIAAGVVGYALHGCIVHGSCALTTWRPSDAHFMARQMGALVEAILVECFKEGLGPCLDRKGLRLEGRIDAAVRGWPAYAAAAVFANGLGGTWLLPDDDGLGGREVHFSDMAAAMLLSCVPPAVRGASNTIAVKHAWPRWHRPDVPADLLRHTPASRSALQRLAGIADKAALRYVLIEARQTGYAWLRERGCAVQEATLITQALYSVFAQSRDLYADVLAGEGWSMPPRAMTRLAGELVGGGAVAMQPPAAATLTRTAAANLAQRVALKSALEKNLATLPTLAGGPDGAGPFADLLATAAGQLAELAQLRGGAGSDAASDAVYGREKQLLAASVARLPLDALDDAMLDRLDAAHCALGMHDARLPVIQQKLAREEQGARLGPLTT